MRLFAYYAVTGMVDALRFCLECGIDPVVFQVQLLVTVLVSTGSKYNYTSIIIIQLFSYMCNNLYFPVFVSSDW